MAYGHVLCPPPPGAEPYTPHVMRGNLYLIFAGAFVSKYSDYVVQIAMTDGSIQRFRCKAKTEAEAKKRAEKWAANYSRELKAGPSGTRLMTR
jgi:hypothetical protein